MPLALFGTNPTVSWLTALLVVLYVLFQIGLAIRIVLQRRAVGESLAWIMVVFVLPIAGPILYLLIGELRLGRRRARRIESLYEPIRQWTQQLSPRKRVDWTRLPVDCQPISLLAQRSLGLPSLPGNQLQLIDHWPDIFTKLLADIDAAESTCHLEFYIWHRGGMADDVAEALIRASRRRVVCRVLVDAIGSRAFLNSAQAQAMRVSGIEIEAALAGGLLRLPFVRFDLRMHRKIVVIDGRIAYTGSLNMVDPRYFKQDADVGQWVDAMVRIKGPVVEALAITFLADWYVEASDPLEKLQKTGDAGSQPAHGDCVVQTLPSGPAYQSDAIEQVLLMAVYSAKKELVLTTPYFVPNDSLRMALISASRRGVKVILVVPAKVDSLMVRYASQAFKGELLEAGIRIARFDGGLLHTKSVTIDGEISLFGSLNLDPRSFHLNFEILLGIYHAGFTKSLRELQQSYIDQSELMDVTAWHARPKTERFVECFARLLGPLL
jgi:cardiolipin synthase A/B